MQSNKAFCFCIFIVWRGEEDFGKAKASHGEGEKIQRRGFAPLAARPARQLSIADFAGDIRITVMRKAKRFAPAKRLPPSNPLQRSKSNKKEICPRTYLFFVAQRRGFEPPDQFSQSHDFQSCSLNHSDISAYSALSSSAYLYYCIF